MSKNQVILQNISKTYKNQNVLQNINLTLSKGKIYGIQGKNGSGKTILFKIICGFIRPDSGTITIFDKELGKDMSFPEKIGILIEHPGFLANYSGFKNLKSLSYLIPGVTDEDIRKMMKLVELDPDLKTKYKNYSLGMKQRLGIAQALLNNPDFLLLDEPTNALDENGVHLLRQLLFTEKEKNKLILMTNHDREELNFLCDEIYSLKHGLLTKV